jgi:phosphatidylinositol alpha 1,6-mannosyltransferase
MRILVVTESFLPTVNGVTNSVCKVLEHLRLRGHEAMVVVPSAGSPTSYAGFPVVEVPALGYRQFQVGLPSAGLGTIIGDFAPDVLHVASPFLLGAQAIGIGRALGIPTVAIFQTDVAGYARSNGLGAATKVAWKIIKQVHKKADLTLVPSTASMHDLESAGIKRLARWGRGVDLTTYHPRNRATDAAARLRAELAPDGETVVGYVGRVAPEKRLERLAALRGLPGVRIVIVGDGPATPAVRNALRGMPVTWLGVLRGTELATAYAALDVFVHTGDEETFGQTVQEAHAAGIPVVAPRSGGPIDLISDGIDGYLVAPGDSTALRRTVELLARDPALRRRMGEAGRRAVLGRSWERVCDELFAHYAAAATSITTKVS